MLSLKNKLSSSKVVLAITRTTFLESIQRPIAFLLYLFSVALTLLVPVFQFHQFSEEGRLARDSGLSCMLLIGMALVVQTAGSAVAGELTGGTAASALGKPVGRSLFVVSKWLGCVALIAVFCVGQLAALMVAERASAHFLLQDDFSGYATDPTSLTLALGGLALALLIAALRHYFWRRRFGVSVFWGIVISQVAVAILSGFYNRLGRWYPMHGEGDCLSGACRHAHAAVNLFYHTELNFRVIPVAILIFFGLMVFAALATALSTRLQPGAVLAICGGVLMAGLAGDTWLKGAALFSGRGILSGVLPDLQNFWLCDAISHGGEVPFSYVLAVGGYALTCCVLFLLLGCMAFRNRDVG